MSEHSVESDVTLPEGVFPSIRAAYEAHDKACVSLKDMWLGHSGGISCPSDLGDCIDCQVTFYNEGLSWLNYEAPDYEDEIHVCGCCALKRGITLYRTQYGVSQSPPPEPRPFLEVNARRPRRVTPPEKGGA